MSAEAATDFFASLGTKTEVKKPVIEQTSIHHPVEEISQN
jgi:hypothetical protein